MKKVSCYDKELLNTEETVERYGLSNRKFTRFLNQEGLPFIVMYHKRKLIARSKFEAYLRLNPNLLEEMKNDQTHRPKTARLEEPHITAWRIHTT